MTKETTQEYMRRYAETRKAAGICIQCGGKMPDGDVHSICPGCREYKHRYYVSHKYSTSYKNKVRYNKRKRAAVCIRCGDKLPDEWHHIRCEKCFTEYNEIQRQWARRKRDDAKKRKVCLTCGRELEGDTRHTNCVICRDKHADKWREYYKRKHQERKERT